MNPRAKRSGSRRRRQGIILLLALLGAGAFWFSRRPTAPFEPPTIPLAERTPKVLLIGIDGVRPDILGEVATPNIDALIVGGSYTARTRTTTPSVSGPSWSSMLTGVWPEKHGVRDNEFEGRRFDEYPDFLTRIEQVAPDLATYAAVDWMPLLEVDGGGPTLSAAIDERFGVDGYELGWPAADQAIVDASVDHLSLADPDAMFVYLGNTDEISHATNSIGEEYRRAIESADRQVGALIAAVRARPTFASENWLVIVSTDHGRRADGGHGGLSIEEMTTFILVSGPAAARGTPAGQTYIVDVAVTALAHLGIEVPEEWGLDGSVVGLP